jgi:type IV secretion system protein VirB4
MSLHNYPAGKASANHWGPAVTVLNTTSGTPYFFNFHVRDVGHTMIIGPTGAGKTVLLNFLCAQAQKFNPRTFFFDKDVQSKINSLD